MRRGSNEVEILPPPSPDASKQGEREEEGGGSPSSLPSQPHIMPSPTPSPNTHADRKKRLLPAEGGGRSRKSPQLSSAQTQSPSGRSNGDFNAEEEGECSSSLEVAEEGADLRHKLVPEGDDFRLVFISSSEKDSQADLNSSIEGSSNSNSEGDGRSNNKQVKFCCSRICQASQPFKAKCDIFV